MNKYLLVSVTFFLTSGIDGSQAVTCYNGTWVYGQDYGAPNHATKCHSCSKIVMYSLTPHGHYHMQKWLCNADIAATGIPLPPNRSSGASNECYAATNAVAYNDGSTFSMACTCCDTSCNGASDFCRFQGSLAACIGVRNNIPKTAYQQPNVELVILANGTIAVNVTDPEDSGVRARSGNDGDLTMTQSGGCNEANDKHHEKKSVILVLILLLTWKIE